MTVCIIFDVFEIKWPISLDWMLQFSICFLQSISIENTFQSVLAKLSSIELEQEEFRQFVTNRFDDIDERQEALYDEIQNIREI